MLRVSNFIDLIFESSFEFLDLLDEIVYNLKELSG